jgi:hypothetical protein
MAARRWRVGCAPACGSYRGGAEDESAGSAPLGFHRALQRLPRRQGPSQAARHAAPQPHQLNGQLGRRGRAGPSCRVGSCRRLLLLVLSLARCGQAAVEVVKLGARARHRFFGRLARPHGQRQGKSKR